MAKDTSRKIFLKHDEKVYSFLAYKLERADGSFYLSIQRDGNNDEHFEFNSSNPKVQRFELTRTREKKITYHSSGCVRYHNVNISSNFFEPLYDLSRRNLFASIVIPSIKQLDLFEGVISDEDFLLQIKNGNPKTQFNFIIAPWDNQIEDIHVAIRYEGLFSLLLVLSQPTVVIPDEVRDCFIFIAPHQGLFNQQAIDEHTALIRFHQKLVGSKDLILYSPNGEGVYKIICAVPMRIPPKTEIQFLNKDYSAEIIKITTSVVTFKVKNQHGHTVKQEVQIVGISLDAEL